MEVWIHPSLRIKALGLTPSSWIQLPGQFQSSLSPTLGGCFITFYTAWHILRWDMQNPLVKTDCPIDTFSATISLGYTPLRYLTVSLTESRLLFRIALPNAASPPPTKSHALGDHPSMAGMWLLWNALTLEFYTSHRSTLDGSRTHKILSLNQAPMPIRLQGQKKCGFSTYLDKKTAKLTHFCFPVSATSSFYATSNVKLLKYRLRDLNP